MQTLFDLERKLHDPVIRKNPKELELLLAPSFFEIGSSGKVWTREEIANELQAENPSTLEATSFSAHHLTDDLYLITYETASKDPNGRNLKALRSSIWKKSDNRWQLMFHQGTIVT